jgi:hypothetical protein
MTSGRRIAKRAKAMQARRAISHRVTVWGHSGLKPGDLLLLRGLVRGRVLVRVITAPTPTTVTASRLGARP